ncbi:MAG: hypothetical protein R3C56_15080 [Pirellulaceae bacterium]
MRFKLTMLVLCVLFIPGSQSLAADGFVPLFDGQTLDGWTPLPGGTWKVSDAQLWGVKTAAKAATACYCRRSSTATSSSA